MRICWLTIYASIFDSIKDDPELRVGLEDLFDGIVAIDEELLTFKQRAEETGRASCKDQSQDHDQRIFVD